MAAKKKAAAKKETKKEVAKTQGGELSVYDAERPDFVKKGMRGSETVSIEDLTIPRLGVIQDLSPQRKSSKPEYIEGAEEGMLFNSVSNRLYGDSVIFVPCYFKKEFLIWGDRKNHKFEGFFGAFSTEAEAEAAREELEDGNKCEVIETAQHYGLIVNVEASTKNEPVFDEIVVPMSKSKLKISRQLNSLVSMTGDDRFARMYVLSGVEAQNSDGQDYYNFAIEQKGYCPEALYLAAEKMYDSVHSGSKTTNYDDESKSSEGKEEPRC